MASPTITIDSTGIHVPTYEDILLYVQTEMRAIYGADLYLEPDSQDGQFVGILSLAIFDAYASATAVYSSYSPQTAQGTGLSNAVKINGMTRRTPSASIVDLVIEGTAGTPITNGVATDINNFQWKLPTSVVIPGSGTITVQAECTTLGAVNALPDTITIIGTPTRGWNTVTNPGAPTIGIPAETDGELRIRQRTSTELPSQALLPGLVGAVLSLENVTYVRCYENDTNVTDANGLPAHSISLVVEGGLNADIADAVYNKKTPGCYTYGSTVYSYVDSFGTTTVLRWYRPTLVPIKIELTLTHLDGWTAAVGEAIVQSLVDYVGTLEAGDDVYLSKLFSPANLPLPDGATYDITLLRLAKVGDSFGTANITILFNERATLIAANVTLL